MQEEEFEAAMRAAKEALEAAKKANKKVFFKYLWRLYKYVSRLKCLQLKRILLR